MSRIGNDEVFAQTAGHERATNRELDQVDAARLDRQQARGRSTDELIIGVAILPEPRQARQPERRLVLAMLREALLDAVVGTGGACRQRAQEKALGWIAGDTVQTGRRGWTFEWCCEMAHVDPRWVRQRLQATLRHGVADLSIMRIAAMSSETRTVERAPSATRRAAWTPERRAAAAARESARAKARTAVNA